ncbi:MAG: hypothetical protein K6C36_07345 [Clostridia bacterium]|nr:hypothetical protein [Clostridia bacterium]
MTVFSGCCSEKHTVTYLPDRSCFEGAKDRYSAGSRVNVFYGMIATDTDYSFYLDGEPLNPSYDEKKGFRLSFVMPDHDVTVSVESRNSMEYEPESEVSGVCDSTLTFDSFDGGGPEYTVEIDDPETLTYTARKKYHKAGHMFMTGSGYDYIIEFSGLKPGRTELTVFERSPIAGNSDMRYLAEVDRELHVTLTLLERTEVFY